MNQYLHKVMFEVDESRYTVEGQSTEEMTEPIVLSELLEGGDMGW